MLMTRIRPKVIARPERREQEQDAPHAQAVEDVGRSSRSRTACAGRIFDRASRRGAHARVRLGVGAVVVPCGDALELRTKALGALVRRSPRRAARRALRVVARQVELARAPSVRALRTRLRPSPRASASRRATASSSLALFGELFGRREPQPCRRASRSSSCARAARARGGSALSTSTSCGAAGSTGCAGERRRGARRSASLM